MVQVALVILTKNEEASITAVLQQIQESLGQTSHFNVQIFLCDDSSDQTRKIASQLGCQIIPGSGRGLGYSYYKALQYFSNKDQFDLLITMDGDGQVDALEIPVFLQALTPEVDMVVGSRFMDKNRIHYKYPLVNHVGVKILALIITLGSRKRFTDSHGGIRVLRQPVSKDFKFLGGHSYVQETIIDAFGRGFNVREISSAWNPRKVGESRVVRSPMIYGAKMLLPLSLRLGVHYLLAICALILTLLGSKLWIPFAALAVVGGCVKYWIYAKNRKWTRGLV